MQLPTIKTKFKYGLKSVLTIISIAVFAVEAYYAYIYLYKNMSTGPIVEQTDKIVRVNNVAYKSTIEFLKGLKIFIPDSVDVAKNPFK